MVACRGAIAKQRAAKAALQAVRARMWMEAGRDELISFGSPSNRPKQPPDLTQWINQEVEAKRRELEELKAKSSEMARRLQVNEYVYVLCCESLTAISSLSWMTR